MMERLLFFEVLLCGYRSNGCAARGPAGFFLSALTRRNFRRTGMWIRPVIRKKSHKNPLKNIGVMMQMMETPIFFRGVFVDFLAQYCSHPHSVTTKDAPHQCRSNKHSRPTRGAALATIAAQNYLEKYRPFHHLHHISVPYNEKRYDTREQYADDVIR